jgi:uncharacterized glyoxalase superfamily protein PhnB
MLADILLLKNEEGECVMLKLAIPVLHVTDAAQAERFYCAGLGFEKRFSYRADESKADPCYIGLTRDGVVLHVSSFSGDGAAGAVVNLLVDDVDVLHVEFQSRGIPIAMPPTGQSWGNREMYVKDADGNSLRFIREG